MIKRPSLFKITILAVLVLASISCNLGAVLNPEPTPVPAAIQVNPSTSDQGAVFTFSLTESQLNEYAAIGLQNNPDSPLKNPVITLPEGLIDITGQFEQPPIKADIHLIARPYTDGNGNLKIEVIKADLGPLPAGEEMLKTISSYVEGILISSMGPVSGGYRIDSVLITGRVLTLSGQQR